MVVASILRIESVTRRVGAGCPGGKIEVAAQMLTGMQKAKLGLMWVGAGEMKPKIAWKVWTVPWMMTTWTLGRLLGQ